jgi:hypothetical protein
LATLGACELQQVTLAEPEDVLVVEALVQAVLGPGPHAPRIRVLLHRTVGTTEGEVPGARVTFILPSGRVEASELPRLSVCVAQAPSSTAGTCYGATIPELVPGMRIGMEIVTVEGERVEGATTVPADFSLIRPRTTCVQEADESLRVRWTSSGDAWAYVAETEIFGLPEALAAAGIETDVDPLYLLGLSVSAADTTLVFPAEFGILERFDLDRDVALYLQQGLPKGTSANITIAAVDRNYVNWVRGGSFNPSGTVRIPSVRGDGTGFFGSGVYRRFAVLVNPPPEGGTYDVPAC